MTNEQKFKQRISELATRIAEAESDKKKPLFKNQDAEEDNTEDEKKPLFKDQDVEEKDTEKGERPISDPLKVIYKDIEPGSPTEKAVLDKNIKNLALKVEEEVKDDLVKIMFSKKPRGGGNAVEFRVEFNKKKPFLASALPDASSEGTTSIAYDPRSPAVSDGLKKQISKFLVDFKSRQGKGMSGISYQNIKLTDVMQKEANKVLAKVSADIEDTIKKATISKKNVGGGTSKGELITFTIEFTNMPKFVGAVKIDPSDVYKNSPDPDEPGSISLNPNAPSDEKGYLVRDKKGNIIKNPTGTPTGFAPVIGGIKNRDPKKMFASLKEILKAKPQVKAGFITSGGNIIDLSRVDYIDQSTKDALTDFLNNLATDELKEEDNNEKHNMKNRKDFKEKISEIASRIANVNEKVDGEKINLPTAYKTQANSAIAAPPDLAKILIDIINELIAGETSMADIEKRTGWNMIMDRLKSISGEKKGNEEVPDVSSDDQKKMGMDLPALQEAFNRINRK